MSQSRDESLRHFAAERVMGWRLQETGYGWSWFDKDGQEIVSIEDWNPLESWADAGQLWEEARKKGITLSVTGVPKGPWFGQAISGDIHSDSGPRAITEAVCTAFGWKWEENEDAVH